MYLFERCPFCGDFGARVYPAEKKWYQFFIPDVKERYYCKCRNCKCIAGPFDTEFEAVKFWENQKVLLEAKLIKERTRNNFAVDDLPKRSRYEIPEALTMPRVLYSPQEDRSWRGFETEPKIKPQDIITDDGNGRIVEIRSK